MKKITVLIIILPVFLLAGCSSKIKDNNKNSIKSDSISKTEGSKKENSKSEKVPVITTLNSKAFIKNDNKVAYTLEVTEVKDVTENAKNKLMNDTNYLNFYSANQGKQAVRVTIKITNSSGKVIRAPYLDDVKIKDDAGINNVGGWKDERSTTTEFGSYQLDSELKTKKENYEVQDGDTQVFTSTVLLVTPSKKISFIFISKLFNDKVKFDLPIMN
ncbi:hypothetical protein RU86_GL000175 [Lactococcus piscium]|uniref:Uncharacterized protein n=1 Tax=Pseudolactococcus piscium TaxID=1364 RepID=A0A2A5S609_9LACT|nr:hypothetical protein [Lactococcus piscium]PCS08939.1 hypothetical protein RU86_GL000175 [Lactococcus piscium]